jgi:hypothetical protein
MKVTGTSQEKLAEAYFFLGKLKESDDDDRLDRPDFGYYLSAFLSAAASVIEVLKKTHNPGFRKLFGEWLAGLSEQERRLHELMAGQRIASIHRATIDLESKVQHVDAFKLATLRARETNRAFMFFTPNIWDEGASVGIRRHYVTVHGSETVAVGACEAYLRMLGRLLDERGAP